MIAVYASVLAPTRPARLNSGAYDALPITTSGGVGSYMFPCPVAVSNIKSTDIHACTPVSCTSSIIKQYQHQVQTYKQRRTSGAVELGWVGGEN